MGRAVGKTIAMPGEKQPFVKVPIFWSAQGQQLRYCGVGAGFDDVIVKGSPEEMKASAYTLQTYRLSTATCYIDEIANWRSCSS